MSIHYRIYKDNGTHFDGDYTTKEAALNAMFEWEKQNPQTEFCIVEIHDDLEAIRVFWKEMKNQGRVLTS